MKKCIDKIEERISKFQLMSKIIFVNNDVKFYILFFQLIYSYDLKSFELFEDFVEYILIDFKFGYLFI